MNVSSEGFKKLIKKKVRVERELRRKKAFLTANNIRMEDPDIVVDADGFPHSVRDDLYQAVYVKNRIICLQNDHKNILKQIEHFLYEAHNLLKSTDNGASSSAQNTSQTNGTHNSMLESVNNGIIKDNDNCFAELDIVQEGSPADLRGQGLCENDKIIQFGSINASNFPDVAQLHNIVRNSVGQQIQVRVKRDRHIQNFTLVCRPSAQP